MNTGDGKMATKIKNMKYISEDLNALIEGLQYRVDKLEKKDIKSSKSNNIFLSGLFLLFVWGKIVGKITCSWWLIFSPIWVPLIIIISIIIIVFVFLFIKAFFEGFRRGFIN